MWNEHSHERTQIMTIRQFLPRMLLILAVSALVTGQSAFATENGATPQTRANLTKKWTGTNQDGSLETQTYNPLTGFTDSRTYPDGHSVTKRWGPDGKLSSITNTDPKAGLVETSKYSSNGGLISDEKKWGDGPSQTLKYDGSSGCKNVGDPGCHLTSMTTTNKDGLREIKNCDKNGNCNNVYNKALSSTEKKTAHPRLQGRPGTAPTSSHFTGARGSMTQKFQAEVLQKIKNKSQSQDVNSGWKTKLNVRGSDLTTGQKSRVGVSTTKKLQTQVLQQIKSKPQVQNWGSSGASAGFSAQRYRRPH
jgi:hypothetical protein